MTKRKDAGTGKYISEEQAEHQDKNTWIEEHPHKHFSMDDRTHLLTSLYEALKSKEQEYGGSGLNPLVMYVEMKDIEQIFKDAGLDTDESI